MAKKAATATPTEVTATQLEKLTEKVEQKKAEVVKVQGELAELEKELQRAGRAFVKRIGLDLSSPQPQPKPAGSSPAKAWLQETLADGVSMTEQELRDKWKVDYPNRRSIRIPNYAANGTLKQTGEGDNAKYQLA